jgi:ribosomal protein S18 acetylase RimI-like enzyme
MIRATIAEDEPGIFAIIEDQFDAAGLEHVKATLSTYLAGDSQAIWLTALEDEPVGVAYCAPEPITSGTWNLLMLWTRQDSHRKGYGSALVGQVEAMLKERGVRLLIVETSGVDDFDPARNFYERCGFRQEARVKDFYAQGDDKLIYTKPLQNQ